MSLLGAAASAAGAPGILVPVVLTAAFLHASWNAILKFIPDKMAASLLMTVSSGVLAGIGCFFLPVPDRASWALLLVSAALHVGYFLMLVKTFEIGDFNQVYPLARGLSPVVVAVFATLLGDPMSRHQTLGIAVVCGGLATLVFSAGRPKRAQGKALFWAAMTGLSIATYTVTDGVAVRHSGTAAGYTAWMMLAEGLMMSAAFATILARRGAAAGDRHRGEDPVPPERLAQEHRSQRGAEDHAGLPQRRHRGERSSGLRPQHQSVGQQ